MTYTSNQENALQVTMITCATLSAAGCLAVLISYFFFLTKNDRRQVHSHKHQIYMFIPSTLAPFQNFFNYFLVLTFPCVALLHGRLRSEIAWSQLKLLLNLPHQYRIGSEIKFLQIMRIQAVCASFKRSGCTCLKRLP